MTAPDAAEAGGHSPLPWRIHDPSKGVIVPNEYPEFVADATGLCMFECESAADAALIVERVNAYDALVAERDALLASYRQDGEALNHFEAENRELREAIWQALDDMGKDSKSVCGHAKALLRLAYGDPTDPEEAPEYTMEEALRVAIECDEMHGKPSGWRKVAAASTTLSPPTGTEK